MKDFNPKHSRMAPRQMTGPVLACEYLGQTYIFDGTNRLNVWLRDGDIEQHETIIVRAKQT